MTNPDSFQPTSTPPVAPAEESSTRSRRSIQRDADGMVVTTAPREATIMVGIELSGDPGPLTL